MTLLADAVSHPQNPAPFPVERLSPPADPRDAEVLARLDANCTPSPWTARQFTTEIEKPWARFWAFRGAGGPEAFVVYWRVADEAQLANIAVAPGRRRQGWGKALLSLALREAVREGAGRMTLEVRENNAAALALYRAAGFRETGRRPKLYEGTVTAVLMEKNLTEARP